jgi:hypothetical protein
MYRFFIIKKLIQLTETIFFYNNFVVNNFNKYGYDRFFESFVGLDIWKKRFGLYRS